MRKGCGVLLPLAMLATLAALWGCGPAISPQIAREAAPGVEFAALASHPEDFRGQTVILGGEIGSLTREGTKTILLINQRPLNADQYPRDDAASGGAFVVESEAWLDQTAYVPQRKITVAGVVAGARQGLPWLQSRQLYLWEHPFKLVPIPPSWYNNDPALEYWFTPPYYDPYRQGGDGRL